VSSFQKASANPGSAPPAADRRPRPNSLIKAPTKIIGNAAAVSERRTPISAISLPVPVVPMSAPNTSGNEKMGAIPHSQGRWSSSSLPVRNEAPDNGVDAAFLSIVRSPHPAYALRPMVMTLLPNRNRPTPPRNRDRR
jgi:hypothetical protein